MKKLLIIGDALTDVFFEGEWISKGSTLRYKANKVTKVAGGAENTWENAWNILEYNNCINQVCCISLWAPNNNHTLYRLISESEPTREFYLEECEKELPYEVPCTYNNKVEVQGIIISDYNKGAVKYSLSESLKVFHKNDYSFEQAPWIIVDSRYRSLHPSWLELGKIKIWRCTGSEYDEVWAQQFDWVVHTDGPLTIVVKNMKRNIRKCFSVPIISVVDVCGAGDTFTAMLGCYLLAHPELSIQDAIYQAIPYCIAAAQEVCQIKYTAITTHKLKINE